MLAIPTESNLMKMYAYCGIDMLMLGMKCKPLGKQMLKRTPRSFVLQLKGVGLQKRITWNKFSLPVTYWLWVQETQVDEDGEVVSWDLYGLKPSPKRADPTT